MIGNQLCFSNLRIANVKRLESTPKFQPCIDWTPSQWLQAVVGELGELANEMKKVDRGDYINMPIDGQSEVQQKLRHEIADVQVYLDLLADKLGIDLGSATIASIGHDGQVYYLPED